MAADTTNTRTKERVESRVETVEVTEYQCANCRQWYSGESDIVPVALNAEADTPADADEVAALCDGCADAVFGYEGDGDASIEALREAVFPFQDKEAIESFYEWFVPKAIVLTVGGIVLAVGMQVMDQMTQAVATAEASEVETLGGPIGAPFPAGMMDLATIFIGVLVLSVIASYLVGGPRMR